MERLTRIGRDLIGALQGAFAWWVDQLLSLVPARAQEFLDRRTWIEVRVGTSLEVNRVSRSARTGLGTIDPEASGSAGLRPHGSASSVVLVPGEADVFAREVRLPRTALQHLRTVVEGQFATWTPFNIDEVHWLARLVRIIDDKHAMVELRFVLKADLERSIEPLRAHNLVPDRVALGSSSDRIWWVPLGSAKRSFDQRLRRGLQLVTACALLVVVALDLMSLDNRQSELDEDIQLLTAQLRPAAAVNERIAFLKSFQESAAKAAKGSEAIRVIVELGNLLAVDDWITEVELEGETVKVKGVTTSPEALTRALAKVAFLRSTGPAQFEADARGGNAHRFTQGFARLP